MAKQVSGKWLYAATAVALVALLTGFALAAITINSTSQNAQGNYVNAVGAVGGLTYSSTVLQSVVGAPSVATGTGAVPVAIVVGANSYCLLAACTAGDPAEVVTYTFTGAMAGSLEIDIVIGGSAVSKVVYLKQAAAAVAGTIVLYGDLGTATATLTGISAEVQQCTGAAGVCP
ncbi:MAG: hypothetical protein L3K03_03540 [Thermoplasmata archaeon]|nr:hypothetical protein [Thermoplasmata archaeon]